MFSLRSLGSLAIQAGRSKLLTFSPCQAVKSGEQAGPAVGGALLQAQSVLETQVRGRRSR